jgi:hypothetical protein
MLLMLERREVVLAVAVVAVADAVTAMAVVAEEALAVEEVRRARRRSGSP